MAYQAEIKVGVRGLKRVQELQSALNKVNIKINAINKVENAKASAGQKQKLTSVEKNLKVETQAAQIQKRALAIKDNILKMDMKGVKVSQVKAKLTRAINQAEKGKFINAKRNIAVAEKELQILKAQTVERGKQAQGDKDSSDESDDGIDFLDVDLFQKYYFLLKKSLNFSNFHDFFSKKLKY